ncbi:MAG TPA: penicillin-binding protein 2 [Steroidobacteraceae bacterium]|jgi:penicillin-binding protein 2|nr:penicillin-binding protein 2 [Steroidobacteraceae bacterium]
MVRSRQSRIKNYFAENRLFTIRSIVAGVFAAVLLLAVAGRLFYLQVIKFDYYHGLSQGNSIRTEPIPPSRGLILDRHGVVLADNMPAFNIELVREQVGDNKALDATLAQLVSIGLLRSEEVSNIRRTVLLHKVYESVPVKLLLNEEEMARFAVHRYQFAGVDIRARLARHYPLREMGVHAIGYVSAINEQDLKQIDSAEYAGTSLIGKLGVEGAYEQQLHGKPGFREIEVNAAGRPVDKQGGYATKLNTRPPVAGEDLILGMDVRVQKVAEEALVGKRGSVVALDPKTGDIIALASTPGFDPNDFVRGLSVAQYSALSNNIDVPLLNRALRGAYPPGSTVKPLYALAAQHYGILTPEHVEYCPGYFTLPGSSNKYRDDKVHGSLDMRHAISESCDVYFYRLADKMGIDRMHAFMSAFGYGELTGIDIPGEKQGLYASPEWKRRVFKRKADQVWFPGESISMGIGQGPITVTPLQQAHFAAEIAERGKIIAMPRLVSATRAPGSVTVVPRNSTFAKPIDLATDEQWNVIYDGMIGAVTQPGATAYLAFRGALYKLAGKTGTAQVVTVKQTESTKHQDADVRKREHAWFIAFAPVDDPKIAISVLIENGGFGGSTAGPIARKVLDTYLVGDESSEPKKNSAELGSATNSH